MRSHRINLDKPLYCKQCYYNKKGIFELTLVWLCEELEEISHFVCPKCPDKVSINGVINFKTIVKHRNSWKKWNKKIDEFIIDHKKVKEKR